MAKLGPTEVFGDLDISGVARVGTDTVYHEGNLPAYSPTTHDHDLAYAPIGHVSDVANPHAVTATQAGAVPTTGGAFTGTITTTRTLATDENAADAYSADSVAQMVVGASVQGQAVLYTILPNLTKYTVTVKGTAVIGGVSRQIHTVFTVHSDANRAFSNFSRVDLGTYTPRIAIGATAFFGASMVLILLEQDGVTWASTHLVWSVQFQSLLTNPDPVFASAVDPDWPNSGYAGLTYTEIASDASIVDEEVVHVLETNRGHLIDEATCNLWRMDELAANTTVDVVGGLSLSKSVAGTLATQMGVVGNAINFDGVASLEAPIGTALKGTLESSQWTIELWVRLSDAGYREILNIGDTYAWGGPDGYLLLAVDGGWIWTYVNRTWDNGGTPAYGTLEAYSSAAILSTNTWHHIAIRCNEDTLALFVDRVLVDERTFATPNSTVTPFESTAAVHLGVGLDALNFGSPLLGHIDDVRISTTPRTQAEITESYWRVKSVTAHAADMDNPHGVTAAQVGAVDVDNATAPQPIGVLAAAAGDSPDASPRNHVHAMAYSTTAPPTISTASAAGSSTNPARRDHNHGHGSHSVGTNHAAVTSLVNGFMSSAIFAEHNTLYNNNSAHAAREQYTSGNINYTFNTTTKVDFSVARTVANPFALLSWNSTNKSIVVVAKNRMRWVFLQYHIPGVGIFDVLGDACIVRARIVHDNGVTAVVVPGSASLITVHHHKMAPWGTLSGQALVDMDNKNTDAEFYIELSVIEQYLDTGAVDTQFRISGDYPAVFSAQLIEYPSYS